MSPTQPISQSSPQSGTRHPGDWWRHAVIYQIYVRSFADGNGDGTGDIAGMRSRLPYLAELGIDAIWVNPWYRSPLKDGGYDVADYRNIDPRFGTIDEAEAFITEARSFGIRVLVDIVPNHTSSMHPWFVDALASAPGSAARARYHFLPGRGEHGEWPPTDWRSVFGGPAWKQVADGEWYLHIFDESQPDLNWEHPEVLAEFESILRFWLDRGVAGFRVDVAHALAKDPAYTDLGDHDHRDGAMWTENHPFWDRDEVHDIIRSWRRILDEYDDRMMVAEAWVRADRRELYLRPDEYHQAFEFDLLKADWNAQAFSEIIERSVDAAAAVDSNPTWVLSNHDVMRHPTRYGLAPGVDLETWSLTGPFDALDQATGNRRARAAVMITLALPGSVYVYQGDELGLPEVWDLPEDVLDDPVWKNSGRTRKGRDGCRVPIPWESSGPSLGFGSGAPWLPQPVVFAELAASEQEADAGSTLHLYRRALAIRRELFGASLDIDIDIDLDLVRAGTDTLSFRRENGVTCIVNMGRDPIALPAGEVLLSSAPIDGTEIPGDTAVWMTVNATTEA